MSDLRSLPAGLWFSAITSTIAAIWWARAALVGMLKYRFPRIMGAVAIGFIAASYWSELFVTDGPGPLIRRGAAWVLWPCLAWTAWVGIRQARRFKEAIGSTVE